jgi:predicted AAA+ superfamily ATPase
LKSAGYKIGKNTTYELVDICRNAYLYFTVPKYTTKIANLELGEKKLFAIDSGLLGALGLVMPHETGKLLEQAVFLECYRRTPHGIFFDANGYECDFLLGEWDQIHTAIQVTSSLEDPKVYQRELKGLVQACQKFNLEKGMIITLSTEERIVVDGVEVAVVPAWKWMISSYSKYLN